MSVSRVTQDQRALDGAQHVALLSAAVGGERGPRGEVTGEMRAQSLTDARPLGEVGRHQRFQGAIRHHELNDASPVANAIASAQLAD